jgi:phosphate ABC transporter permease subunit PstA
VRPRDAEAEYAQPDRWCNRVIEINIQNLAAVPSIVYGILGLGIISRGLDSGQTVLTAALTLSLLVLPVVIISSREAIRAVPQSIRQASLALGATQWQAIWRQVLPAAIPGTATGSILALSRAMGEAAPLLLIGGLTFITYNPTGVESAFSVLPIQIFNLTPRPHTPATRTTARRPTCCWPSPTRAWPPTSPPARPWRVWRPSCAVTGPRRCCRSAPGARPRSS